MEVEAGDWERAWADKLSAPGKGCLGLFTRYESSEATAGDGPGSTQSTITNEDSLGPDSAAVGVTEEEELPLATGACTLSGPSDNTREVGLRNCNSEGEVPLPTDEGSGERDMVTVLETGW